MRDHSGRESPIETIDLAATPDFALGSLQVQPSHRRVSADGRDESVEPRVMQALVALAEADGAVVSRDMLIERCWGGRIVGEDAINRCIAKVRRLADTAQPPAFTIRTISKVGYVLEVAYCVCQDRATIDLTTPHLAGLQPQHFAAWEPPVARRRLPIFAAAAVAIAVVALAWLLFGPSPPPPADRMTLRIEPFIGSGAQQATDLAARCTQAAIERLSQSELLVVSTASPAAGSSMVAPRFTLTGTVQTDGILATVAIQVIERANGRLLYAAQTRQQVQVSQPALYMATVILLSDVEGLIRESELARYTGPPRDSMDLVMRASAALQTFALYHDGAALALGERALAVEPGTLPAQAVMANLLFSDFLASDARKGDAEGRRALDLIENVLLQHPRNLIDQHLRARLLAALGDLKDALTATESALAEEPDHPGMLRTLSDVLLQQGDVIGSIRVMTRGKDPRVEQPALQAFAQSRFEDALAETRRIDALTPPNEVAMLFRAAVLVRVGQVQAARAKLDKTLPDLPLELRHVAALRQFLFALPDESWALFKESLREAGMPP